MLLEVGEATEGAPKGGAPPTRIRGGGKAAGTPNLLPVLEGVNQGPGLGD